MVALRKDQLGCHCGKEVLEEKNFRTLTLLRSNTPFVLVCREDVGIGIIPPILLRKENNDD